MRSKSLNGGYVTSGWWEARASSVSWCVFFFNDTATTEIYTLSLHDALPICVRSHRTQPLWHLRGKRRRG